MMSLAFLSAAPSRARDGLTSIPSFQWMPMPNDPWAFTEVSWGGRLSRNAFHRTDPSALTRERSNTNLANAESGIDDSANEAQYLVPPSARTLRQTRDRRRGGQRSIRCPIPRMSENTGSLWNDTTRTSPRRQGRFQRRHCGTTKAVSPQIPWHGGMTTRSTAFRRTRSSFRGNSCLARRQVQQTLNRRHCASLGCTSVLHPARGRKTPGQSAQEGLTAERTKDGSRLGTRCPTRNAWPF